MIVSAASRSRLYELRRDLTAARRGADLLERKREVLLRETARRAKMLAELRAEVREELRRGRVLMRIAEVDIGPEAIAAAGFAQPLVCTADVRETNVMGVRFKVVQTNTPPFRAVYGPAGTSASLDGAAAAFTELLPRVIELAALESAVARLRIAVRKATKIVNALQKVVLPQLERAIHQIAQSIEEEERDEAVRQKRRATRLARANA